MRLGRRTVRLRVLAARVILECADLSALWSGATCRTFGNVATNAALRRQAPQTKAATGRRTPKE